MSTATTAAESVTAKAARRGESSTDGVRFAHLVGAYAADLAAGRPVDEPARLHEDEVLLAAFIEAQAGLRRLLAQAHPRGCECDGCRTHLYVTARRRYDQ